MRDRMPQSLLVIGLDGHLRSRGRIRQRIPAKFLVARGREL
jgi:hypothetical protein